MTATSINHLSVQANDLDESVAFYEQLFGMESLSKQDSRRSAA